MLSKIVCLECASWRFRFKSDRTGNVRRYVCGDCGAVYIGTIKGLPCGSVISEPKNLSPDDLDWVRVLVVDENFSYFTTPRAM